MTVMPLSHVPSESAYRLNSVAFHHVNLDQCQRASSSLGQNADLCPPPARSTWNAAPAAYASPSSCNRVIAMGTGYKTDSRLP